MAVAFFSVPPAASAQGQGPPQAVREAIDALVQVLQSSDEASIATFAETRLSEAYRNELGSDALDHLAQLRAATPGAVEDIGVEPETDGSMTLILRGSGEVTLNVVLDEASGRFDRVELRGGDVAAAGTDRPAVVDQRVRAIEALRSSTDSIAAFRDQHLAPELRSPAVIGDDTLTAIARAAASAGSIAVELRGDGFMIALGGEDAITEVFLGIGDAAPFWIESLRVETSERTVGPPLEPLAWDDLGSAVAEATAQGFSGTILAVRDGSIALHQSYGAADRTTGRPNTNETIYGVGSIPIDFTRAAIYLLAQRGALDLNDPISVIYPDAPADKSTITIGDLMSGQSGLPNFHHEPTDADYDLTWIDRSTAEQRILAQPLLFTPGTDRVNSHSAFVLLAAVIERVSGQSYEEVLKVNFFEPAGMHRTGSYGDLGGHDIEDFAVGHDGQPVGDPNIPPNWGPTSWLIMGSGGMYSTPTDMYRWFTTLRGGEILTGDALNGYLQRGNASGASDRGFLFMHAWAGGDSMVFVAQNGRVDAAEMATFRRRLTTLAGER